MNNTQLKILALVCMTIDHIGAYLLPDVVILRYIGRIAFPLFAYMVCEGCIHTSNKVRYLLNMCGFGIVSQLVMYWGRSDWMQSIFTTLILSAITVFALMWWVPPSASKSGTGNVSVRLWLNPRIVAPFAAIVVDVVCCNVLPSLIGSGFRVQYGIVGVLLPACAYAPYLVAPLFAGKAGNDELVAKRLRVASLVTFGIGLVVLGTTIRSVSQPWAILSLIPLALYNGERGRLSLKYLFYAYYPLHLAVIYAVARVIK